MFSNGFYILGDFDAEIPTLEFVPFDVGFVPTGDFDIFLAECIDLFFVETVIRPAVLSSEVVFSIHNLKCALSGDRTHTS